MPRPAGSKNKQPHPNTRSRVIKVRLSESEFGSVIAMAAGNVSEWVRAAIREKIEKGETK